MSSQPLWEDPEADRVNAARDALRSTFAGRMWLKYRKHWMRHFIPRGVDDEYVLAMRAHFHAMAEAIGRPVLTTRKPT
jgi:hypothetical protein